MADDQKTNKKTKKAPYDHKAIELKWQAKWEKGKVYQPDLDSANEKTGKTPLDGQSRPAFYNLMMFPYPSAEGLHVGSVYAFGGADVYGRFKRMQGYDVFEPIGLDGFGIHSENHAIKTNSHPIEHAKRTEENFYRQLHSFGNSFAWDNKLETYSPQYYQWTQWLFVQLFKSNLAYRKKSPVNYCPFCKTVLADEQVIDGKCERCNSNVEKRDLEQWYFRITNYAERLLNNIKDLNWTEKVKIAQINWIGKSEGARVSFPLKTENNYVLLHGFMGSSEGLIWIKSQLEQAGAKVTAPDLPNANNPTEEEQVNYVLENISFNEKTILFGHSLGAVVALKVAEKLKGKIAGLVLAAGFVEPKFLDRERPFKSTFNWEFDFASIRDKVGFVKVLTALNDSAVPQEQGKILADKLKGELLEIIAEEDHFCGEKEPTNVEALLPYVEVFTTRPDTLHGATFMVISPEHPLVTSLLNDELRTENKEQIRKYVEEAKGKSEVERQAEGKEKTGVFSGLYAINPVNGQEIPIWIADYVLMGYGTGAIMAVPAHDERDFEFAKKFGLEIKPVIASDSEAISSKKIATSPTAPRNDETAYTGPGVLVNSGEWDGLKVPSEMGKVLDWLEEKGIGKREVNYHLRDWLISRQRYWGPPIPLVYCESCAKKGLSWFDTDEAKEQQTNGKWQSIRQAQDVMANGNSAAEAAGWYPVPEDQLPVELPYIEDFKPMGTGKSPLANYPEFYEVKCPHCGADARRETDVSDTFLDSAWYFLRYLATDWEDVPFPLKKDVILSVSEGSQAEGDSSASPQNDILERRKSFLPVHMYIGGAEHSVLHLLYARFITMVLHDLGYLDFEEPFSRFYAHGLIIKDGAKMSKSKGNVINPDDYIAKYGADTLRCYLQFLGPFNQGGDFRDSGIEGMNRFLKKVWRLFSEANGEWRMANGSENLRMMHKTIKRVTEELEHLRYNTAIAGLMEWYNFLSKQESVSREEAEVYLKLLAPFAPHMVEELYQMIITDSEQIHTDQRKSANNQWQSIHLQSWPRYDEKYLVAHILTIAVQVNGRLRGTVEVAAEDAQNKEKVEELARKNESVVKFLTGEVKHVVYIPGKILNFVVV